MIKLLESGRNAVDLLSAIDSDKLDVLMEDICNYFNDTYNTYSDDYDEYEIQTISDVYSDIDINKIEYINDVHGEDIVFDFELYANIYNLSVHYNIETLNQDYNEYTTIVFELDKRGTVEIYDKNDLDNVTDSICKELKKDTVLLNHLFDIVRELNSYVNNLEDNENVDSVFNYDWFVYIINLDGDEIENELGTSCDMYDILEYMKNWDYGEYTEDNYEKDVVNSMSYNSRCIDNNYYLLYTYPDDNYYLYRKLSNEEIQEQIDRFGYIGNQRTGKFYS